MLHAPDPTTPLSETVDAIQELHKEGRFTNVRITSPLVHVISISPRCAQFGLSNFSATQVQEIYDLSKSTPGGVLPSVYQGQYNLLCRSSETDLLPLLRSLNIKFQAYSPLCGGLFVKEPSYITQPPTDGTAGRWATTFWYGGLAQRVFNKPSIVRFLEELDQLALDISMSATGVSGPSTTEVKVVKMSLAYRWAMFHSHLDGAMGDEVVFASNRAEQVDETMREVGKGKLEEWVEERLEEMWERVRAESPPHDYLAYGLQ